MTSEWVEIALGVAASCIALERMLTMPAWFWRFALGFVLITVVPWCGLAAIRLVVWWVFGA